MLIAVCDFCRGSVRSGLVEIIALKRCECGELGPYDICEFCVTLLYMINLSVWKSCIDEEKFTDCNFSILDLKNFQSYLPTETFFVFNSITNYMEVRLHNPDNVFHLPDIEGP